MKILITINHPAHVHYFKNFINAMELKGHKIIVSAQNKDIIFDLLKANKINYFPRMKTFSKLSKILNLLVSDFMMFRLAMKFSPDVLLGFGGGFITHVSKVTGIPSVVLDDTEHAKLSHLLFANFASVVLVPFCYKKKLKTEMIKFHAFTEQLYLDERVFSSDNGIREKLGIAETIDYVIVRFIAWNANHDIGQQGLSEYDKIKLIHYLDTRIKVFISSEAKLPIELEKYKLTVSTDLFHDILASAAIYIGEGGTTASEAAILGIPTIYINNLSMGYIDEEIKYGIVKQVTDLNIILEEIDTILNSGNRKKIFETRKNNMLKNKININDFLVWFVENYPESAKIMKENPGYQNRFK